MSKIKILHAADLHLDSPFEGLPAGKAAIRRGEQRALLSRIAELTRREGVQLVLLAGDLLDSENTYYETGEELCRSLSQIAVPVFISPGNHDFYSPKSVYARLKLPENVHVFTSGDIEAVTLPELGVRVFGAAFTDKRSGAMLRGFHAERKDGLLNILCIHGDVGVRDSVYDPISEDELRASGMDYAALGHVHKASGLKKAGDTWYSWPGCPEGRGFDETGEKGVLLGTIERGRCDMAGEVGHMSIEYNGKSCPCGRKGCWERYASASALKWLTQRVMEENPESILRQVVDENDGHVSGQSAFIAARRGDPVGQFVCDAYIDYLCAGIVNLVNIFQPDTLAIGGGVSNEQDEQLLFPVRRIVAQQSIPCEPERRTRIVKAELGSAAGIIGAALLGKKKRI